MSPDINHLISATRNENLVNAEVKSNNRDEATFVESGMLQSTNVRLAKFVLCFKLPGGNRINNQPRFYNDTEIQASQALLELVNKLLDANLPQFENLLREMDYSETTIGDAFSTIAKDVLQGDDKGITWTRIAILFAFAVMMAKTCLPQSSPRFLDNFSVTVGDVIEEFAGAWIARQGGWKSIKSQPTRTVSNLLKGITVLGAAVTIFGYSQATSAFTLFLKR